MNEIRQQVEDREQLLMRLVHAAGAIEGLLERAVEASGLSLAKLGVLRALVATDGALPLGRLAESLCCAKSNVTQLIDRLEAEGLVRREADPEDRRSTLAVITEEGRRRYEAAARAHDEAERRILERLPAEQRERLAALLLEIRTAIA
jgi:DNA-binding MarR family transcriptional regulator